MSGEIAIPISVYAAVEADAAREAAELAERRAFMAGYSHANATPEERQRYVESVRIMYPPQAEKKQMDAVTAKCMGAMIVVTFVLIVGGGIVGWARTGNFEEGAFAGFSIFCVALIVAFVVGFFCLGVGLLFL